MPRSGLEDNPEFASQAGVHRYDHRLQDLSPGAFAARIAHNRGVLALLTALRTGPREPGSTSLKARLFEQSVRGELEALELGCHLYPINSIGYGGVHENFIEALDWLKPGDDDAMVARLEAFPAQVESYKSLLRAGVAARKVASAAMVRNVPGTLAVLERELAEHTGSVAARVAAVNPNLAARAALARAGFGGAITGLRRFLEAEYIPHVRQSEGLAAAPNGPVVYAACLRFHTTTTMTAAEVHAEGLAQVARIEARYRTDVMEPFGWTGPFADFVETICKDPTGGQYYGDRAGLITDYYKLLDCIAEVLPSYFEDIPADKLEIVEKDSPTAPAAYYMQGTADGSRPGRFYVNVSNLEQRPKYEMCALTLHEAIPGHHMQGSLAIGNKSLPDFLRFIEDRRYEFCAARRQLYAAYLEGWALYCEALGEEMGIYKTPMDIFGRLSMEMMRAVRLVVDTGIHAQGWSVERAIKYMMEKTGMHLHECEAECYRYEAWPGQACAYKIGEVAMWAERRKAEAKLGARFSLPKFHSVVLRSGPVPLDTLGTIVDEYIETELAAAA